MSGFPQMTPCSFFSFLSRLEESSIRNDELGDGLATVGGVMNSFVKLTDEHKSTLDELGTIEQETITGIEETYRVRDRIEKE